MTAEQKWRWKCAVICSVPVTVLDMLFPGHIVQSVVLVIIIACIMAVYSIKRWP